VVNNYDRESVGDFASDPVTIPDLPVVDSDAIEVSVRSTDFAELLPESNSTSDALKNSSHIFAANVSHFLAFRFRLMSRVWIKYILIIDGCQQKDCRIWKEF